MPLVEARPWEEAAAVARGDSDSSFPSLHHRVAYSAPAPRASLGSRPQLRDPASWRRWLLLLRSSKDCQNPSGLVRSGLGSNGEVSGEVDRVLFGMMKSSRSSSTKAKDLSDLKKREKELQAREAELNKREKLFSDSYYMTIIFIAAVGSAGDHRFVGTSGGGVAVWAQRGIGKRGSSGGSRKTEFGGSF